MEHPKQINTFTPVRMLFTTCKKPFLTIAPATLLGIDENRLQPWSAI